MLALACCKQQGGGKEKNRKKEENVAVRVNGRLDWSCCCPSRSRSLASPHYHPPPTTTSSRSTYGAALSHRFHVLGGVVSTHRMRHTPSRDRSQCADSRLFPTRLGCARWADARVAGGRWQYEWHASVKDFARRSLSGSRCCHQCHKYLVSPFSWAVACMQRTVPQC